ncbi:aspartate/glutamate racemase family protein [Microbacterium enclense]|uniref:aspartate/glutamate racemase family protein n=1 Tax=Microbacterium enclense TaxID=993073 RepID=UPI0021A87157|nr:aspartate/glutamate racemase family protein [Microbacterium enclense]
MWIAPGPSGVESRVDQALAVPGVIRAVIEAERDGVDAVIVNCGDDPGLFAARDCVRIPVIGVGEASIHVASQLGDTFSIVGTSPRDRWGFEALALRYRLEARLRSVRWVDTDLGTLWNATPSEEIARKYIVAATQCVADGAHVIVPGCTLFGRFHDRMTAEVGVPAGVVFIDPVTTALQTARMFVDLGLSHARSAYDGPDRAAELAAYMEPLTRG